MRIDRFPGQVIAVISRRSPAFELDPDEPQTFAGRLTALFRQLRHATSNSAGRKARGSSTRHLGARSSAHDERSAADLPIPDELIPRPRDRDSATDRNPVSTRKRPPAMDISIPEQRPSKRPLEPMRKVGADNNAQDAALSRTTMPPPRHDQNSSDPTSRTNPRAQHARDTPY